MYIENINKICLKHFGQLPEKINRNETGISSYVYTIVYPKIKYIIKISENSSLISGSTYWYDQLKNLDLPIPKIISLNTEETPSYCIMTFLEGEDLGKVYNYLSENDKKNIADQMFYYQNEAKKIPYVNGFGYLNSLNDIKNKKSSWYEVVSDHIKRSEERIIKNKIFPIKYVNYLKNYIKYFEKYFYKVKSIPFFDDLTTKNVLIKDGKISGIVDLDWVCFGDRLYVIALCQMSLLNMNYDIIYINYWKNLENLTKEQKIVFLFYILVFCVDFMSEKGMKFNKEIIEEVRPEDKAILENIFSIYNCKLKKMIN